MGFIDKIFGKEGFGGSVEGKAEMNEVDYNINTLESAYNNAPQNSEEARRAFEAWDNYALEHIEQLFESDKSGQLPGAVSMMSCPPGGRAEQKLSELRRM